MDDLPVAGEHRPLEDVLQLAHIAGPVVAHQHVDGGCRDAADLPPVLPRVLGEEVVREQHDVRFAVAQRRDEDGEDVQAVVQVLAELALGHARLEVAVGGHHQPDVDADRFGAAKPLELPLLKDAQELHLAGEGDLADLVEEDGAGIRQLEAALLALLGAGEGPALVPEQLGLDQGVGQRRAAHLDEGLGRARRVVMDGVGDQFLAGA